MITRSEEQSHSIREFMRGGKKHVEHTLLSSQLPERVRIFNLLDSDGDGLISRQEAQQAFLLRPSLVRDFENTDTNKDGYLSEAEVRAQAERRRAERRARRAREQAQKEAQAKQAQASAAAQNKQSN